MNESDKQVVGIVAVYDQLAIVIPANPTFTWGGGVLSAVENEIISFS